MKEKKKAKGKEIGTGTSPHSEIQNSINESFAQMKTYNRKSKRQCRLIEAVMYYLAKDMVPFYTIENGIEWNVLLQLVLITYNIILYQPNQGLNLIDVLENALFVVACV